MNQSSYVTMWHKFDSECLITEDENPSFVVEWSIDCMHDSIPFWISVSTPVKQRPYYNATTRIYYKR